MFLLGALFAMNGRGGSLCIEVVNNFFFGDAGVLSKLQAVDTATGGCGMLFFDTGHDATGCAFTLTRYVHDVFGAEDEAAMNIFHERCF
jgi:hypothetical protein